MTTPGCLPSQFSNVPDAFTTDLRETNNSSQLLDTAQDKKLQPDRIRGGTDKLRKKSKLIAVEQQETEDSIPTGFLEHSCMFALHVTTLRK